MGNTFHISVHLFDSCIYLQGGMKYEQGTSNVANG